MQTVMNVVPSHVEKPLGHSEEHMLSSLSHLPFTYVCFFPSSWLSTAEKEGCPEIPHSCVTAPDTLRDSFPHKSTSGEKDSKNGWLRFPSQFQLALPKRQNHIVGRGLQGSPVHGCEKRPRILL